MTQKTGIKAISSKPFCSHIFTTFLGIQQTNVMNKFLYLYNCDHCGTTLSFDKKRKNRTDKK